MRITFNQMLLLLIITTILTITISSTIVIITIVAYGVYKGDAIFGDSHL